MFFIYDLQINDASLIQFSMASEVNQVGVGQLLIELFRCVRIILAINELNISSFFSVTLKKLSCVFSCFGRNSMADNVEYL